MKTPSSTMPMPLFKSTRFVELTLPPTYISVLTTI